MKLYKIKISNTDIYARAVMFGQNPFVQILQTFEKEDAAIYEEDKAKAYVEMLNKENEGKVLFELEGM